MIKVSDTRYFGALHLAVLTGEAVLSGYYTGLTSDVQVDAAPWKWVRIDPSSLTGVDLSQVTLKAPTEIYSLLASVSDAPVPLTAIVETD